MNRITIKHVGTEDTQTDFTLESFLGTQISTPGGSIYHVGVMVTSNINLIVGEHLNEEDAQKQVGIIWESYSEVMGGLNHVPYLPGINAPHTMPVEKGATICEESSLLAYGEHLLAERKI